MNGISSKIQKDYCLVRIRYISGTTMPQVQGGGQILPPPLFDIFYPARNRVNIYLDVFKC